MLDYEESLIDVQPTDVDDTEVVFNKSDSFLTGVKLKLLGNSNTRTHSATSTDSFVSRNGKIFTS